MASRPKLSLQVRRMKFSVTSRMRKRSGNQSRTTISLLSTGTLLTQGSSFWKRATPSTSHSSTWRSRDPLTARFSISWALDATIR
ncbi:uncharacterized protein BJX67DRAFT_343340 [Aspergillus lucknowensis]|uniref:Uncharacterized protein n=1 Tax=Aspergillus lucknowensis TaxID=176173 RepID=A0ABR4M355_9EURO